MTAATDFCNLLYQLADESNGQDLRLTLQNVPVLVIQERESAEQVLKSKIANYEKNMPWFRQAFGPSRITENGEAWRFRQRLSQSYLAKFNRQAVFERCVLHGRRTAQKLSATSAGGGLALDDADLRSMSAAVLFETFFGKSLQDASVEIDDLVTLISFSSEYSFMPVGGRAPLDPKVLRDFLAVRARVLDSLRSYRLCETEPDSLLAEFRTADSSRLNGFVLEHELTFFFLAGVETTSSTLGWAMNLLARHPEIQEELRDAISAFWSGNSRDWETLSQIDILANFVDEVLRIFPATPVVSRKAVSEDRIGRFDVKPEDHVLISIVGLQHDRRVRPDPWKPSIHSGVSGNSMSISFGAGPRVCGGARFAHVELMSFLSIFLAGIRFELTDCGPPRFRWQTLLMHEGGQPIRLMPIRS